MKKILFALFSVVALLATSCSKGFDDSEIWDKLNSLEERVAALEQLCKQMNTNITSLQTIVDALQKNDSVTNVAPINEDGDVVGYTITFAKGDSITIYLSGNASAPQIGVKKHKDGIYYWTLGGEWLLDDEGNKVKAQGNMPKLKVENEYWYVSYDNGSTWSEIGEATSDDGDSMFTDVTYDDDYVYLTLSDGTILVLPRSEDYLLVPTNQIWYTSTSGEVVTPYNTDVFGANIVSNVYEDGKGIITFDDDVTKVGNMAFYNRTSLTRIVIPMSVTEIGNSAFYSCSSMTHISLPDGVTTIGYSAFVNSGLEKFKFPSELTSIGNCSFFGCTNLKTVICSLNGHLNIEEDPDGYEYYGMRLDYLERVEGENASDDNLCLIINGKIHAFAGKQLSSYTIPDGVNHIGPWAFANSKLERLDLRSGIYVGDYAFYRCNKLKEVNIPYGVDCNGAYAFAQCTGTLNIDVQHIGWYNDDTYAPFELSDFDTVVLGPNVKSVVALAAPSTLYCKPTTPPECVQNSFYNCKIYVPTASVSAYKSASGWSNYASKIEGYTF